MVKRIAYKEARKGRESDHARWSGYWATMTGTVCGGRTGWKKNESGDSSPCRDIWQEKGMGVW